MFLFLPRIPLQITAEHNNFSDSVFFAPDIMRRLKSAGKMDGVSFIDQVRYYGGYRIAWKHLKTSIFKDKGSVLV